MRRLLDALYDGAAWLGALFMIGTLVSVLAGVLDRQFAWSLRGTDMYAGYCMAASGFLALAKLLQQPLDTYLEPAGAVQRAVRQAVAEACEVEVGSLVAGTDGCSAPNYSLPLISLATGFKNLATANGATPSDVARKRVREAMLAHPVLVSGEGRLDYDLSRAFPGRALVKGGAEALLLLAFAEPGLGIAIMVRDGGSRALGPIAVETLKQVGLIGDLARFPSLQRYEAPSIENARQLVTGEVRAELVLERA